MHEYINVCAGCRFVEMYIVCREGKKEGGGERSGGKGRREVEGSGLYTVGSVNKRCVTWEVHGV